MQQTFLLDVHNSKEQTQNALKSIAALTTGFMGGLVGAPIAHQEAIARFTNNKEHPHPKEAGIAQQNSVTQVSAITASTSAVIGDHIVAILACLAMAFSQVSKHGTRRVVGCWCAPMQVIYSFKGIVLGMVTLCGTCWNSMTKVWFGVVNKINALLSTIPLVVNNSASNRFNHHP